MTLGVKVIFWSVLQMGFYKVKRPDHIHVHVLVCLCVHMEVETLYPKAFNVCHQSVSNLVIHAVNQHGWFLTGPVKRLVYPTDQYMVK